MLQSKIASSLTAVVDHRLLLKVCPVSFPVCEASGWTARANRAFVTVGDGGDDDENDDHDERNSAPGTYVEAKNDRDDRYRLAALLPRNLKDPTGAQHHRYGAADQSQDPNSSPKKAVSEGSQMVVVPVEMEDDDFQILVRLKVESIFRMLLAMVAVLYLENLGHSIPYARSRYHSPVPMDTCSSLSSAFSICFPSWFVFE